MRAKKHTRLNLFLTVLLCCALPVIILFSCKVQKVGPISPEPLTPEQQAFVYVAGRIVDYDLETGVSDVTVTFADESSTTNANGAFSIDHGLTAGVYQMAAEKSDYINIYRTVVIEEEDIAEDDLTLVFSFEMKKKGTAVSITANTGGVIQVGGTDSQSGSPENVTVTIPSGALSSNTQITVTPVPIEVSTVIGLTDPGYAPVFSLSLEPHGITFAQAVQVTIPNPYSPDALVGGNIIIKTTNPNTGQTIIREEANPVLSADGKSITYSALHFSVDNVTSTSSYSMTAVYETPDVYVFTYPENFDNGVDARLTDCANDIGNFTGSILVSDRTNYNYLDLAALNLEANGQYSTNQVKEAVGEIPNINVTWGLKEATYNLTLSRLTAGADKVGVQVEKRFRKFRIFVAKNGTQLRPNGFGYILVPMQSGLKASTYVIGTCHDQGG